MKAAPVELKSTALLNRSIIKKQIIALTGFLQTFFIIGHLAGNLLLYGGHELFNTYAETLTRHSDILWVVQAALICSLLLHLFFGVRITLENWKARGKGYKKKSSLGRTSFVKKTMIWSGLLLLAFLILHLNDFTFAEKKGAACIVRYDMGEIDLGLYGLVWNSFLFSQHWWRPLLYMAVVAFLGMHLCHGIRSIVQTFGFYSNRFTPTIERISWVFGLIITLGFWSIPIYVNMVGTPSL